MADQGQAQPGSGSGLWVLLSYRVPREPSAPRIAIWRKLKRLGVAQLGDGLVGLPADARTREQLEWIADEVTQAGGSAGLWLARPATAAQERELAEAMAAARAAEYEALAAQALAARAAQAPAQATALRRLRGELRRIIRRDYFPPMAREQARAAVEALAREQARAAVEALAREQARAAVKALARDGQSAATVAGTGPGVADRWRP